MRRFSDWSITTGIAHMLLVAVASADADFSMHNGYIAGGSDLGQEYLTVTEAKARCLEKSGCKGFTFMGPPSEGPMWVNFKSEWNVAGDGWTSYRREDKASLPPEDSTVASQALPRPDQEATCAIHSCPTGYTPNTAQSASTMVTTETCCQALATDAASHTSSSEAPEQLEQVPGSSPSVETSEALATDAATDVSLSVAPEQVEQVTGSSPSVETSEALPTDAATDVSSSVVPGQLEQVTGSSPSVETSEVAPLEETTDKTTIVNVETVASQENDEASPSSVPDGLLRLAKKLTVTTTTTEATNYSESLFVGKMMAMTQRAVVGLGTHVAVFCYANAEVGAACMAGNTSSMTSGPSSEDSRMLPPVPWGIAEAFHANATGRLEVVRLTSVRFAVCFERVSDSSVLCAPGVVLGGEGSASFRCTFGSSITLGVGHLMSTSPAFSGQKLAACFAAKHDGRVVCRWARVQQEVEQPDTFELSWIDGEAQAVKTV